MKGNRRRAIVCRASGRIQARSRGRMADMEAPVEKVQTTEADVAEARGWVENADTGFPVIKSPAYATESGTPYLRAPGVALLSKPQVAVSSLADFLGGFNPELQFLQYLDDPT